MGHFNFSLAVSFFLCSGKSLPIHPMSIWTTLKIPSALHAHSRPKVGTVVAFQIFIFSPFRLVMLWTKCITFLSYTFTHNTPSTTTTAIIAFATTKKEKEKYQLKTFLFVQLKVKWGACGNVLAYISLFRCFLPPVPNSFPSSTPPFSRKHSWTRHPAAPHSCAHEIGGNIWAQQPSASLNSTCQTEREHPPHISGAALPLSAVSLGKKKGSTTRQIRLVFLSNVAVQQSKMNWRNCFNFLLF